MKINFSKHLRDRNFISWFLMAAIADDDNHVKRSREISESEDYNSKDVDVTLTMNGVELNFVRAMERLEQEHRRQIKEEAKEIVDSRVGEAINELTNDLYDKGNEIRELLNNKLDQLKKKLDK